MNHNPQAVAVFDKLAGLYQEKFMDVSLYHDTFDIFCRMAVPHAEILELACGPGNITKYLIQKRPDFKILATDLAPGMIDLAQANNPAADVMILDCRRILSLGRKFDGIMCGFCFPYLTMEEVITLISDAAAALNFGGVLYISTMEDSYSRSGFERGSTGDEIFMHYHEEVYIVEALRKNDFSIIDISRKVYPGKNDSIVTDLLIIAQAR